MLICCGGRCRKGGRQEDQAVHGPKLKYGLALFALCWMEHKTEQVGEIWSFYPDPTIYPFKGIPHTILLVFWYTPFLQKKHGPWLQTSCWLFFLKETHSLSLMPAPPLSTQSSCGLTDKKVIKWLLLTSDFASFISFLMLLLFQKHARKYSNSSICSKYAKLQCVHQKAELLLETADDFLEWGSAGVHAIQHKPCWQGLASEHALRGTCLIVKPTTIECSMFIACTMNTLLRTCPDNTFLS